MSNPQAPTRTLSHSDLLQLKRWNTPSIYNGWEQITKRHPAVEGFNREETRDFMPHMGPMVGYAVTVVIEPSTSKHHKANGLANAEYLRYVASIPGPKIAIVQDLDKPNHVGAFWGEVNSNIHRTLGCVGTITEGAIRDVDEMMNAGFKALARRLCVGHAFTWPVRWNCPVEVFGTTINPGDLIHADKHGFMSIAPEEQPGLLEAVRFMDANECETVIPAARGAFGKTPAEIEEAIQGSIGQFRTNLRAKYAKQGEW